MGRTIGAVRIQAVKLRKEKPNITLEEIGILCGVTKQRIYKIFQDEGVPRRPKKLHKKFKFCRSCRILISLKSYFCSLKCRDETLFTILPCAFCGKAIKERLYIIRHKLKKLQYSFFCNRICFNGHQRQLGQIRRRQKQNIA